LNESLFPKEPNCERTERMHGSIVPCLIKPHGIPEFSVKIALIFHPSIRRASHHHS
jgi:hypothetical protein